jgi:YesN/AraC family two-component response regulator
MKKSVELKKLALGISVIYVEDNTELRNTMTVYLQKLFDDVRVGTHGEEGLRLYKERPCDLIITDILMPIMSGMEMLKIIKELRPTQSMLITSAYSESEFFIEAIRLGVTSYIIKPIDYNQLIDVLYTAVHVIAQDKELEM